MAGEKFTFLPFIYDMLNGEEIVPANESEAEKVRSGISGIGCLLLDSVDELRVTYEISARYISAPGNAITYMPCCQRKIQQIH